MVEIRIISPEGTLDESFPDTEDGLVGAAMAAGALWVKTGQPHEVRRVEISEEGLVQWEEEPAVPAEDIEHWVTLSNHRRVALDDEGRIQKGLPGMFRGIHVQDISPVYRRHKDYEATVDYCLDLYSEGAKRTFETKEEAMMGLLAANPQLAEIVGQESTELDTAFREWVRGGRRGPKPVGSAASAAVFDAINERLELHGKNKVTNWREAIYRIVPNSRRWDEFAERLWILEETAGIRIAPPEPTIRWVQFQEMREKCAEVAEDAWEEYLEDARSGRVPQPDEVVQDGEEIEYYPPEKKELPALPPMEDEEVPF